MCGLWEQNSGFRTYNANVSRIMEFRTVPAIFAVPAVSPHSASTDVETANSEGVLANVFDNRLASWLYSSVDQGVYNSTPPAWTSQEWSFTPLNLTSIHAPSENGIKNNATVEAPSLRGRLECTPIDMSNTSAWLTTLDFRNKTAWNDPKIPANLTVGYELKLGLSMNESVEGYSRYWGENNPYFSFFSEHYHLQCCGNEMNSTQEAAIGYWSRAADAPHTSIVVKWITGNPFPHQFKDSTLQNQRILDEGSGSHLHWVWKDIPKVTALNCTPVFETANAKVTVDLATGTVQNYTILDIPVEDKMAWASQYQSLNVSTGVPYSSSPIASGFQVKPGVFLNNVTVRCVFYP